MPVDFIVKLCFVFYSDEEIEVGKNLLFNTTAVAKTKVRNIKGREKIKRRTR